MDQSELWQRITQRSLLTMLLLVSSGCALLVPEPPATVVTPAPSPPPIETPKVAADPLVVDLPAEPRPVAPHVAIVLSDSLPAYTDVASELVGYLEDYSIYELSNRTPRQTFAAIADSDAKLVVAVGLSATKFAKSYSKVPVIFSQVFNVSENGLIADDFKGVAALPPMELQIKAWRELDPDIRDIGAILGEGHEDLIAEADQAMKNQGINFHYAVVQSDRQTLYVFNRLIRRLDGFLLFPDNRILSRAVLTEIMSDAARHQVQVAVFNESLLEHGATFSASSVNSNIAEKIAIALNEILDGNIDDVAPLSALSEIRIQTNPAMIRKFGLEVSAAGLSESVVADTECGT